MRGNVEGSMLLLEEAVCSAAVAKSLVAWLITA